MSQGSNRRDFIKTSAVIGAGYFAAAGITAQETNSPNGKIAFASIGVGGKGDSDSRDAGNSGDLVAICDVDDNSLNKKATAFPKAMKFYDYRKMFEEMGKSIDAVTVSTPDHSHAPAALMAMRMGKHCFCQKPLTHTIEEARLMGQVAREKKLATQMGNQGTAENSLREMAALLRSGFLGTVKEVHIWTNRPVWPQGEEALPEEPIPSNVKWDLFIGPAKMRPYNKGYHPFKWRGWWDFGTGALGDMACHTVNMPYMGLDLKDPTAVQAETSGHNKQSYPSWSIITFDFPAIGERAALKMMWYDGGKKPAESLLQGAPGSASGALIIGEKGSLYAPGDYAERGMKLLGNVEAPKVEWPKSPGHFDEWVRAIKGGEQAKSNFADYAGPLTEVNLLGNLAVWAADQPGTGKKIEWDAKNMVATNAPEVMHIVKKEYHNGYSIKESKVA
jgi:predicted dehydrogenase